MSRGGANSMRVYCQIYRPKLEKIRMEFCRSCTMRDECAYKEPSPLRIQRHRANGNHVAYARCSLSGKKGRYILENVEVDDGDSKS